jgi:hypothetical protein
MGRAPGVAMTLIVALCLTGGSSTPAQQPASGQFRISNPVSRVQSYDQPEPGARSPRNANYDIDVRLNHEARRLEGRETIRWRNISSQSTSELQLHLYWNAWRDANSTWMRERRLAGNTTRPRDDAWGRIDITRLRVRTPLGVEGGESTASVAAAPGSDGREPAGHLDLTTQIRFIAPDDGNLNDKTVAAVTLPYTVGLKESLQIEIEWSAKVPQPFARTGYIADYYFLAQWFPKLGVLEDAGWNTHQFHAATEFYADYGVYDVRMTVPRGFVVGGSGRAGERRDNTDGTTTHRYHGEDIHDFAWTASPRFIDEHRRFEHPTLPAVDMRLLLLPEHRSQAARHFEATAATLKYYGEWFGPYPYDHVTIVDPAFQSRSGGMEYPTFFTAGTRWLAPETVATPEAVTVHEAGHQFWYGVVGSNEFENAWMDEGLNTFSTGRVMAEAFSPNYLERRFFGGVVPWVFRDIPFRRETDENRLSGYRNNAEADVQATPTFRYWPGTATFVSYNKTALWLNTLERHLGWPVLQRIMATYFDRFKFRHPAPVDFFNVVNEVSGRDMTWFFEQVYQSSNVFDYGIQEFESSRSGDRYRTVVVARRFGEATFPVDVVTTFRGGETVRERWDGRERRAMYTYERPSQAVSVQIDPERVLLLDVNYTNNSRTMEPRAADASLKWSLKWLIWLEDLMLTYGFFW